MKPTASITRPAWRSPALWPMRVVIPGLLALLLLADVLLGRLPLWTPVIYAALGLASFALYGLDKKAAERGARRIPERTLHTLDLLFGIAGGMLGQQVFRHKTAKPDFRNVTLVIAALHGVVLSLLASGIVTLDIMVSIIEGLAGQ